MAIRANRYNDPSLGAAFENIASLFAPMSGSDLAGYPAADLNRGKAASELQKQGLIDMFAQGGDDRIGIAAGLYAPNQSYHAVNTANDTARRGQDISSADTRHGQQLTYDASVYGHDQDLAGTKYASDNTLKGTVFGHVAAPLGQGEVRMVPDDVTAWATGGQVGGIDQVGAPKPLSKTEVEGELLSQMAGEDPAFVNWILGGSKDPVSAVDAEGNAVLARPHEAAGMGVYEKPSAESFKLTNVRLPDGTQATAVQTPQGLVDPQTRQPLPEGTTMFSTSATGSNTEVGLNDPTVNRIDQQLLDIGVAQGTAQSLRQMISDNAASQGLVGSVRMTAQNVMQTGNELGQFMGKNVQAINNAVREGLLDAEVATTMFDPSLPAIDMLSNMLAFQYAKSLTGERLSNEMLRSARRALGLDNWTSNQADSLSRLDTAIAQLDNQSAFLRQARGGGGIGTMGAVTVPPPAPQSQPVDDASLFQKYGLQP